MSTNYWSIKEDDGSWSITIGGEMVKGFKTESSALEFVCQSLDELIFNIIRDRRGGHDDTGCSQLF